MIPWKLIGKTVWRGLKILSPAIAVVLIFVLAYQRGATQAGQDLANVRAELKQAQANLTETQTERDQAKADLEAANLKVAADAAAFRTKERELRDAADIERTRLLTTYGRALEEERAESAGLRDRVSALAPGEACLIVMKEMADALR